MLVKTFAEISFGTSWVCGGSDWFLSVHLTATPNAHECSAAPPLVRRIMFSFASSDVIYPREDTLHEKVTVSWPPVSLRSNPMAILVIWKNRSAGCPFLCQIRSWPFCLDS